MADHKSGFDLLYQESREELIRFSLTREPDEAEWFASWISASDAEYHAWESQPMLRTYLDLCARAPFRGCALLGYVYLHLCYNLPRLLADSFRENPSLPRERCWRVFMEAAGPGFVDMTVANRGETRISGFFAILLTIVPGGRSATDVVCNWVLAQRSSAFLTAERLSQAANRAELEQRLWQGMEKAAQRTFSHPNPLHWMRSLPLAHELVTEPAPPGPELLERNVADQGSDGVKRQSTI